MNVFRDIWEKHIRLLTEAVDEITTIEDFLAISENHVLEDINSCIQAMVERNTDRMKKSKFFEIYNEKYFLGVIRTAEAIQGRTDRVIDVVTAEMEKYESGEYTDAVLESVRVVREQSR